MKFFITGICGFVGTNLVLNLLQNTDHEIIGCDNFSVNVKRNGSILSSLGSQLKLEYADIKDTENIIQISQGCDVIVHLAGRSGVRESITFPREWTMDNVIGTFNILEAARYNKIRKVIFASSGASIGNVTPPVHEEMVYKPISPYGATKASNEAFMSAYFHSYGIETISLRFSNVYGPNSIHKESLVAKFLKTVLNQKIFEIYGDGEQTRDFIFVDDLCDAIIQLSNTYIGGEVFQLSSNFEYTVNEVINMMTNILREKNVESDIVIKHGDFKNGDIQTNYADNSKLKTALNWSPRIELKNGLNKTIDWFLQNYEVEHG